MNLINPQAKPMIQSTRAGTPRESGPEQGQSRTRAPQPDHTLSREPREEGRCFEHLLEMKEEVNGLARPWFDIATLDPQWSRKEPPEQFRPSPLATWDALLAQMRERLASHDEGLIKFELVLPNLGAVSAQVSSQAGQINVNLAFAREQMTALHLSQERQYEAWLSRQLRRPVRLSLQARES